MLWLALPLAFALGFFFGRIEMLHQWNEEDKRYGRLRWMQGE